MLHRGQIYAGFNHIGWLPDNAAMWLDPNDDAKVTEVTGNATFIANKGTAAVLWKADGGSFERVTVGSRKYLRCVGANGRIRDDGDTTNDINPLILALTGSTVITVALLGGSPTGNYAFDPNGTFKCDGAGFPAALIKDAGGNKTATFPGPSVVNTKVVIVWRWDGTKVYISINGGAETSTAAGDMVFDAFASSYFPQSLAGADLGDIITIKDGNPAELPQIISSLKALHKI